MTTVPVYIVSSQMLGQRQKLDMVADNVANANTSGYKKLGMDFQEIMSRQKAQEVGSFTHHNGTFYDFSQGGLTRTEGKLDVAINGAGFFATDRGGVTHYTRNGHFSLNPNGDLITDNGDFVLDANNAPINIPADSNNITITGDGVISNQNGAIATLGVFTMSEPQKLIRTGTHGYIYEGEAPALAENTALAQGFIENSNINPIEESVNLTEINRRYQSSARLVRSIEELEQRAIRDLSRMPQ